MTKLPKGYKYCPRCGSPLEMRDQWDVLTPTCTSNECGHIFWQNAKPATCLMIPNQEGKLLFTVRDIEPERGLLDLPGGFLNETEDPIDGAKREAAEELGVIVDIIECVGHVVSTYGEDDYFVLNIGYHATIAQGEPRALDEIAALEWVDPTTVDPKKLAFVSNEGLLEHWRSYRARHPHAA